MVVRTLSRLFALLLAVIFVASIAACGSSSGGPGAISDVPVEPEPEPEPEDCSGTQYESTFDAVQTIVFEEKRCANAGCHDSASAAGGLDLTQGNAWANLHDVDATVNSMKRIVPGSASRSLLYQKLASLTLGEEVDGAGMPIGSDPLSENDLDLVRWWIYGGAPEEGVVLDAQPFIDGCLPDAEPLTIKPLEAPAAEDGLQFRMPTFRQVAGVETERCFISRFDVCDQIPESMITDGGIEGVPYFSFDSRELRMDPGSHHLIVSYLELEEEQLNHPDYGDFRCRGGSDDGELCDAMDLSACAEPGLCASDFKETFACIGFGAGGLGGRFGGAQRAQDFRFYPDGVYNTRPCRGFLQWNAHNFNLTTVDQFPQARLNYYFADPENLLYRGRGGLTGPIFIADNPPFTRETFCAQHTFPRGTRLYNLTSHTHKHGERFWITGPDGDLLYENFRYNDPVDKRFDPELEFDSVGRASRTVEFCATYNNGVGADGLPDPEMVTRSSRVPASARNPGVPGECEPVACVNPEMIGEPCFDGDRDNAGGDHEACDSSPGAGDGFCDACNITGGESTENEMFLMIPAYYVVDVD